MVGAHPVVACQGFYRLSVWFHIWNACVHGWLIIIWPTPPSPSKKHMDADEASKRHWSSWAYETCRVLMRDLCFLSMAGIPCKCVHCSMSKAVKSYDKPITLHTFIANSMIWRHSLHHTMNEKCAHYPRSRCRQPPELFTAPLAAC